MPCLPQVPGAVWQLVSWQYKGSLENDFKKEQNRLRYMGKAFVKQYRQLFSSARVVLFELQVVSEG